MNADELFYPGYDPGTCASDNLPLGRSRSEGVWDLSNRFTCEPAVPAFSGGFLLCNPVNLRSKAGTGYDAEAVFESSGK
jgi:hypothetical protein